MTDGTVGVITNPVAGKDIRRLVGHASHTSDAHKIGQIRRAVIGAFEGGARRVVCSPDNHRLAARATDDLDAGPVEILDHETVGASLDTRRATQRLREIDAGAIVVFGGDGTHRDVARVWADCCLVPVSTGTNNVFPRSIEATAAGEAAAVVAVDKVAREQVARRAKVLHAAIDNEADDLALVDIGRVATTFVGSRAVFEPDRLTDVVACIAESSSVGLSAIVARVRPTARDVEGGVHIALHGDQPVRAPIGPGQYADVKVAAVEPLDETGTVTLDGPCVLAFDGERDRLLAEGQRATITIRRDGPWVIDPEAALRAAHGGEGR